MYEVYVIATELLAGRYKITTKHDIFLSFIHQTNDISFMLWITVWNSSLVCERFWHLSCT